MKTANNMNYYKYCKHLQQKYGIPTGSYFLSPSLKSKNLKITRGRDGLYIHHICENEYIMLCDPTSCHSQNISFSVHEPQNLCYCDLLEHMELHVKIVEEYAFNNPTAFVGIGGIINFLIPELELMYTPEYQPTNYLAAVKNRIINKKTEYEQLKKYFWKIAKKTYSPLKYKEFRKIANAATKKQLWYNLPPKS